MDQNIKPTFKLYKGLAKRDEITAPWRFRNQDLLRNPNPGKTINRKN
jgi:hypothetical protein